MGTRDLHEAAVCIGSDGGPHPATWGGEGHVDLNEVGIVFFFVYVKFVNEAEVDDVDWDFGVVNLAELLPEGVWLGWTWVILCSFYGVGVFFLLLFAKRVCVFPGDAEHPVGSHDGEVASQGMGDGNVSSGGKGAGFALWNEGGFHITGQLCLFLRHEMGKLCGGKLFFNPASDLVVQDLAGRESFKDFFEESIDEEFPGKGLGNASCSHIEELLGINLASSGTMRAFDVIGEDFQPREGVSFSRVIQKEVSIGLIGIRLLGIFGHFDHAGEDGPCIILKSIFVEEAGLRVGGQVKLVSSLVDLLFPTGNGQGVEVGIGTCSGDDQGGFLTKVEAAEVEVVVV